MEENKQDLILFDEENNKITNDLINFYNEPPIKDRKIIIDKDEKEDLEEDDDNIDDNINIVKNLQEEEKRTITQNKNTNDDEITYHQDKYKQLIEIGALYLPEDYEIPTTEEAWEKALKDSEEFRQKDAVQAIWEKLPEEGRPLLEYMLAGGTDINKFKEVYNSEFDINKIDINNEEHQKQTLEQLYLKRGFSKEKAKKQVEIVENLMELDTESWDAYEELKELDSKEKTKLMQDAANSKKEREIKETQKWNLLQTTLEKTEDFGGGYVINKKSKPKALESLYKQVKLDDGSTTTDFNYRLRHVVLNDPKLTLVLSDLLNKLKQDEKTKELYFDLSSIKSSVETKITKSFKDKLDNLAQTTNKFKNGSALEDKKNTDFWSKVL